MQLDPAQGHHGHDVPRISIKDRKDRTTVPRNVPTKSKNITLTWPLAKNANGMPKHWHFSNLTCRILQQHICSKITTRCSKNSEEVKMRLWQVMRTTRIINRAFISSSKGSDRSRCNHQQPQWQGWWFPQIGGTIQLARLDRTHVTFPAWRCLNGSRPLDGGQHLFTLSCV